MQRASKLITAISKSFSLHVKCDNLPCHQLVMEHYMSKGAASIIPPPPLGDGLHMATMHPPPPHISTKLSFSGALGYTEHEIKC